MSMKVKSARFFKATGPRSLFSAFQNGGWTVFWLECSGLIIRQAVKKTVARLTASHRKRLENFKLAEWSALAIDLRLDGVTPVGLYLETMTSDGPLRVKVSTSACEWECYSRSLIYVTDSDGLSDEILGSDAVTSGAFYEYVRDSWGTHDHVAMWRRYKERILKEDPAHYCVDISGRATF